MKTIGIIGGMSCISTALYDDRLNADNAPAPVFDTTLIHADAALEG